jgi:hypothetical protein
MASVSVDARAAGDPRLIHHAPEHVEGTISDRLAGDWLEVAGEDGQTGNRRLLLAVEQVRG